MATAVEDTPEAIVDAEAVLELATEPREWILAYNGREETFIQEELSFATKFELYGLLGEAMDRALEQSGEDIIAEVFGGGRKLSPEDLVNGNISFGDMMDIGKIMRAVAKLLQSSPQFIMDLYVIILAVPPQKRDWARAAMAAPASKGGLSDEQGFQVLETFVDQNAEAIEDFFIERLANLAKKARKRFKKLGALMNPDSQDTPSATSSKPSKRSAQVTDKASKK